MCKTREQTLSLQGKKQREALQQLHFITSKLCNYVSKLKCNWTLQSIHSPEKHKVSGLYFLHFLQA